MLLQNLSPINRVGYFCLCGNTTIINSSFPAKRLGDVDSVSSAASASPEEELGACLIPCAHIYDPVCANDGGEETREFSNECSMLRFNCESNKSRCIVEMKDYSQASFPSLDFQMVDPDNCQPSDSMSSGAVQMTMF